MNLAHGDSLKLSLWVFPQANPRAWKDLRAAHHPCLITSLIMSPTEGSKAVPSENLSLAVGLGKVSFPWLSEPAAAPL